LTGSLVIGAAGFIGRRLALALRSQWSEVRALARPEHDTRSLEEAGVLVFRGDATDRETVIAAAEGCGVIYHLAAARGPKKLGHRAYRDLNRKLSKSVGEAALAAGVERVVLTSTAAVTGYPGPERQTEDTPAKPNSPYRASRLEDEGIFEALHQSRGLDVVIARLPQRVMGPGAHDWRRVVSSVRNGTIRFLPAGGTVHSGDVDDVVDGLELCARTPGIAGLRFLLGAPAPMETVAVLRTIAEHLGVPFAPRILPASPYRAYVRLGNLVYRTTGLELPHAYTADFYSSRVAYEIGRARRELGYSPRYEMAESIGRTVSWLGEQGLAQ
jgi:nucleoside-diphosphate-sugar epimerase